MESAYSVWMGLPVILQVAAGEMRLPLRGKLVGETLEVLHLRMADRRDLDIFKSVVLAIEEDIPGGK